MPSSFLLMQKLRSFMKSDGGVEGQWVEDNNPANKSERCRSWGIGRVKGAPEQGARVDGP